MGTNADSPDRDDSVCEEATWRGDPRVGELLRRQALWAEIPADLEGRILAELGQLPPEAPSS